MKINKKTIITLIVIASFSVSAALAAGLSKKVIQDLNTKSIPTQDGALKLGYLLGPFGQAKKTNTDGSTVTFNFSTGELYHGVTLAGNRTFAFTNPTVPCLVAVDVTQDSTGSRTVTWDSDVVWAGGSAPTLTTTMAKVDRVIFWFDGTSYHDLVIKLNNAS